MEVSIDCLSTKLKSYFETDENEKREIELFLEILEIPRPLWMKRSIDN